MTVPAAAALAAASNSSQLPGGFLGSLLHFHGPAAYAMVGLLAFAEAALLVGFFIPGETAVVIGGVLAGLHQVNLGLMMAVVVVCAIVGDSVGYEVGKRAGPWLLSHRPMKGNVGVAKTMALLERHGGPAVFLGRFLAFARAVIPGLAGFSGLRYRTFLLYNATGRPPVGDRLHPARLCGGRLVRAGPEAGRPVVGGGSGGRRGGGGPGGRGGPPAPGGP